MIVVLVSIIIFMVRNPTPSADKAVIPKTSVFINGLLAAVAVGLVVENVAPTWIVGVAIGALVAFLYAMLSRTGSDNSLAIGALSGLFGAVGLFITIGSYFSSPSGCAPADIGQRVLGLVLVCVAFLVGAALAGSRSLFRVDKIGPAILATFGALEIVQFLSSPLGVSLVDLGVTGWVVSLVAALAVGFAAPIWPELVIGVASLTVIVASVLGSVVGSATCLPGPDVTALAPIIGFVAVYFLVSRGLARLLPSK